MHTGVIYALLAAVLFGASTPFAKSLLGQMPAAMLAGILYLGSGLGLLVCYAIRAAVQRGEQDKPVALTRSDLPWFAGAILAGGVAGPLLLMIGLGTVSASSASLLLNMEGVLTSMLAWFVFREILEGEYVAQQVTAPGERVRGNRQAPERLNSDLRLYTYDGHIQWTAAPV